MIKKINFYSISDMLNEISNGPVSYVKDMIIGNTVSALTGFSKTGKSALALKLAYCVSAGKEFLGKETTQAGVLYISLDTNKEVMTQRIKRMGIIPNDNLHFYYDRPLYLNYDECKDESTLSLLYIIMNAIDNWPNLKLVIIDLFDNIRVINNLNEYSNAKVKSDVEKLIDISDHLDIAILAISHDTKGGIRKGYQSAKGGVDYTGTINGSYLHLIREGIGNTLATLEIGGRVIPEDQLQLEFNPITISYELAESNEPDMDINIAIVRNYIIKKKEFNGTLSELCSLCQLTISATSLGRLLASHKEILSNEGINIIKDYSHMNGRIYHFTLQEKED